MPKITFTPDTYYAAAGAHLATARRFLDAASDEDAAGYQWAHCIAGLAVECIIRAHGMRAYPESFTGHHELMNLASKAGFLNLPREEKYDEYRAALDELNARWDSRHRFMAEPQLERDLKLLLFDKNVKGSRIKYSSARMYELASVIVNLGVVKWTSQPK